MADILVVDDHPLYRLGFAQLARASRPAWTPRFANTAAQALAAVAEAVPALVIVDVVLPGEDGFSLVKSIAAAAPGLPQILTSGREDAAVRIRAWASGARGFIAKNAPADELLRMIDKVLGGGTCFATDAPGGLPDLSARQSEILMLLSDGHGNKEIRHRLNIAERTVRAHITELFQVLGAHSRMQALIRARELGLIA